MGTKILICSKKRVHGRILKNGFAQLIPESLENIHPEGTYFEKISETLFTLPYSHVTYQYLEVVWLQNKLLRNPDEWFLATEAASNDRLVHYLFFLKSHLKIQ